MKCKYPTRDLNQRLNGSVCRFDGRAVYLSVDGNGRIYTVDDYGDRDLRIEPNDERLDISSVPLGYINTNRGAIYYSRRPVRRYKQGVDETNIYSQNLNGDNMGGIIYTNLYSRTFLDMVDGVNYPTLDEAIRQAGPSGVAISREVAISKNKLGLIHVYYRNSLVGWCSPDEQKTVIVPSNEMAQIVSKHIDGFGWEIE